MAARDGEVSYDQLHHSVASGIWDAAPGEAALLAQADAQVGGADAWLIIDDTALPKKGRNSVGMTPPYAKQSSTPSHSPRQRYARSAGNPSTLTKRQSSASVCFI
jgi:SRSO17 transposase